MDACFEPCGRSGCSHARWNHRSDGPCRAGPDTYECGCESFVEPERNVGEKMVAEALAIAAEKTPLEAKLHAEIKEAADRDEAFRVRLRALVDEWTRDPGGSFGGRGPSDCARELREALEGA